MSIARVIVVGAGIVGAACAAALAESGFDVLVIDRGPVGAGATAAGMGHLVAMDDSEAQFALTRYSLELWRELSKELPAACEYLNCGTIWVAADDDEMAEVARKHQYYASRGVRTAILHADALYRLEPNLRAGLAGGLLVPGDGVAYPPPAAAYLLDAVRRAGGIVHLGTPVRTLTGHRATLADGRTFECDFAVLAAGALASALCPGLQITPRKGHLVITDRYPGFVRHQLVELGYLKSAHSTTGDSVAFNVQPRPTGQLLIGSSRQYGDTSPNIDQRVFDKMLRRAVEYMPEISTLNVLRTWTGFRAATPDKLPLIGRSLHDPELFLATGHEGLGITTSLGTARLLVDQILGRKSAISAEPYLPSRFSKELAHA